MQKNKAFTLIELLLVVAIAAGIFALSSPYTLYFYKTNIVTETRDGIANALERARHNAILQKNDSDFGVHFVTGSYIIFQGDSYDERVPAFDEVFPLITEIDVSGESDVIFQKLTGLTATTSTTTIAYDNISKQILINDSGSISKL